jgi:hypothetical protein
MAEVSERDREMAFTIKNALETKFGAGLTDYDRETYIAQFLAEARAEGRAEQRAEMIAEVEAEVSERIREYQAAAGWQDISTAPRDGTWVLTRHPFATIPIIARPCGPGSELWEAGWGHVTFKPKDGWLPLPEPPR